MAADASGQVAVPARRPAVSDGIPILVAKITVPDVPEWAVPRTHITKLIAEGTRRCPLTIVTGPPGAGKTTALALWAAAEARTVAWISLDDFDNQPGAFSSYAVAALGRSGVALPEALLAASRRRAAGHAFLLQLVSVLAAQNPPVPLAVDDLHVLTKPTVVTELDFVLRNAQPGLRMVVSSRADPPLPLHRYRLAGELAEIRASDLAFSAAEADQMLAKHGSSLSADSVKRLTRRTEGWAAGLRLAAISMDVHPDLKQFAKELITDDSALTRSSNRGAPCPWLAISGACRAAKPGRGRSRTSLPPRSNWPPADMTSPPPRCVWATACLRPCPPMRTPRVGSPPR